MLGENELPLSVGNLSIRNRLGEHLLIALLPRSLLILAILIKHGLDICLVQTKLVRDQLHQGGSLPGGNLSVNTRDSDKSGSSQGRDNDNGENNFFVQINHLRVWKR